MIRNYQLLSFFSILFFFTNIVYSQRTKQENFFIKESSENFKKNEIENSALSDFIKKRHFVFHFQDLSTDTLEYYKAAYYFSRFNNYRFFDSRRIINFSNRKVSIELFSVKEIDALYGKKIKTFVPVGAKNYPEIEFVFSNGLIKEQRIN